MAEALLRVFYLVCRFFVRAPRQEVPPYPEKILVVRLDSLGDVLLSEPAIAALRRGYPGARLDVVVGKAGQAVLEGNPNVDNIHLYEAPWHAAWRGTSVSWLREVRPLLRALRRLRRERYSLVCELRGDFRDILFAAGCGAPALVGSSCRGGSFLLTRDAPFPAGAHQVDFALAVAAAAGAPAPPQAPHLYLDQAQRHLAAELLPDAERQRYVAFHLGAGFASKCLPADRFVGLAQALLDRSARVLLVGGEEDDPLAEEFLRLLGCPVLNLVGRLTVRETAAVLERCALFVGNDSGPMHLAAAVGTPVVAAFGPSDPSSYHPYGVPHRIIQVDLACRPCDFVHCTQEENLCMSSISPQDLVEAAQALLDSKVGAKRGA